VLQSRTNSGTSRVRETSGTCGTSGAEDMQDKARAVRSRVRTSLVAEGKTLVISQDDGIVAIYYATFLKLYPIERRVVEDNFTYLKLVKMNQKATYNAVYEPKMFFSIFRNLYWHLNISIWSLPWIALLSLYSDQFLSTQYGLPKPPLTPQHH
jgi:hypothetical protein